MQRSLTSIDGVSKVEVSLETREAVVVYDDEKTKLDALLEATQKAGYPSKPKGEGK